MLNKMADLQILVLITKIVNLNSYRNCKLQKCSHNVRVLEYRKVTNDMKIWQTSRPIKIWNLKVRMWGLAITKFQDIKEFEADYMQAVKM